MSATDEISDRKIRHQILRKLERADWAMKEDDRPDALKAVSAACRIALKLQEQPAGLPEVLGRAMTSVIEAYDPAELIGHVVTDAVHILVLGDENFRPCDYGM